MDTITLLFILTTAMAAVAFLAVGYAFRLTKDYNDLVEPDYQEFAGGTSDVGKAEDWSPFS